MGGVWIFSGTPQSIKKSSNFYLSWTKIEYQNNFHPIALFSTVNKFLIRVWENEFESLQAVGKISPVAIL